MKTIIFTDGASRGNPGRGGWGSIIITPGMVQELGGRNSMTTNNKMELTAVIEALRAIADDGEIDLYTDSQYVIKGMTEWMDGWIAKGWKNSQKKPVMNRDLWEQLLDVSRNKKINWKFIRGHADTAGNIRCDEIATKYADGENMKLYKGSRAEYPIPNILRI